MLTAWNPEKMDRLGAELLEFRAEQINDGILARRGGKA
jgi:hypothetical protein